MSTFTVETKATKLGFEILENRKILLTMVGSNDLSHQFHLGSQLEHIIQDPYNGNDRAAKQDACHVTGQFHAGYGRCHEPDINGQPAHPWHDPVVDFPGVGSVYRPDFKRQSLDERSQYPADDQRYAQCQ